MSIALWIVVFTPQIWENYQLQSGDGLSVSFIVLWFLGDVTNLFGASLAHLLPTMVILALYVSLDLWTDIYRTRVHKRPSTRFVTSCCSLKCTTIDGKRPSANQKQASLHPFYVLSSFLQPLNRNLSSHHGSNTLSCSYSSSPLGSAHGMSRTNRIVCRFRRNQGRE